MNTPSLAQFKKWSKAHKSLAEAVCMAKAFAQVERERVNAYIQPLFESFGFVDDEGNKIESQNGLYRCNDEVMLKVFYAESDAAHRAHGFTGPEGHCPALRVENLQIQSESYLLKAGAELLGFDADGLYGENRAKMLDLLMKSCLAAKQ